MQSKRNAEICGRRQREFSKTNYCSRDTANKEIFIRCPQKKNKSFLESGFWFGWGFFYLLFVLFHFFVFPGL